MDKDREKWKTTRESRADSGRKGGLAKARNARQNLAKAGVAENGLANLAVTGTDSDSYSEKKDTLSGKPDPVPSETIGQIVDHLNEKAETSFEPSSQKTRALINARFKEGSTETDFFTVIDGKCRGMAQR